MGKLATAILSGATAPCIVSGTFDRFKITISACKRIHFACGLYTNSRTLTESTGAALAMTLRFRIYPVSNCTVGILDSCRNLRHLVEISTQQKKLCCIVSYTRTEHCFVYLLYNAICSNNLVTGEGIIHSYARNDCAIIDVSYKYGKIR